VDGQFEAVCQQRSEHQLLRIAGEWRIGFGRDVEALAVDPARPADEKIAADVVSDLLRERRTRSFREN